MPVVNKAAAEFAKRWKDKGNEKQDSQNFWRDLLSSVLGIANPEKDKVIEFEKKVSLSHASNIDAYITGTQVIIEQKSFGIDLEKPIRQSDGAMLTPFQQAKRYNDELPHFEKARWIVVCNFQRFLIYDMNHYHENKPVQIELSELGTRYNELKFLVKVQHQQIIHEQELSIKAGELIGKIYNLLKPLYKEPNSENSLKAINKLCVRLVFCLYAEDAGLFDPDNTNIFGEYLEQFKPSEIHTKLQELFEVLDQKTEDRYKYLDAQLNAFPYVNGGLFSYDSESPESEEIPIFTAELKQLLIDQCSKGFDWERISPTIFGALFESTLNPESRRTGGMHYTSVENIHKVIDPLFLDSLYAEYNALVQDYESKYKESDIKKGKKKTNLNAFINNCDALQDKIASLNFLDPACGSGNFLTETYICLRRLENSIIQLKNQNNALLDFDNNNPVKVSINQFYGIEINDFAVSVATTALWIAESQMLHETENIIKRDIDFLPLSSNTNIYNGNALRIDWNSVIPKEKLNYIMGNPPFVGSKYASESQKKDLDHAFAGMKVKYRGLDYVTAWYFKASQFMQNTKIKCALVSTNSITQGEQVNEVWSYLFNDYNADIIFAYQTFIWDSEALSKAHVHCVIIGFCSYKSNDDKFIYYYTDNKELLRTKVNNINGYLIDADSIFIKSRNKPLCNVPLMIAPNKPCDYNHLKIEPEEYQQIIKSYPETKQWIKRMVGAKEFLQSKERYCLWLKDCSPRTINSIKPIRERVEACKKARIEANTPESLKLADTPWLFREQLNPKQYLIIPCVSSETRKYIPIGFLNEETIPVMGTLIIPNATIYDFGILESVVHMAWMRVVAGRLEMRYRYSKDIVYNNFVWPEVTESQKEKISKTAQAILNARVLYPDSSLADLYNPITMPPELLKAHKANDKAVMALYGFDVDATEETIVAKLMQMYADKVKELQQKSVK